MPTAVFSDLSQLSSSIAFGTAEQTIPRTCRTHAFDIAAKQFLIHWFYIVSELFFYRLNVAEMGLSVPRLRY